VGITLLLKFSVWQIFTKCDRTLTLKLQSKLRNGAPKDVGILRVHAEESITSRSAVEVILRCSHLDNKDLLSKSVC